MTNEKKVPADLTDDQIEGLSGGPLDALLVINELSRTPPKATDQAAALHPGGSIRATRE